MTLARPVSIQHPICTNLTQRQHRVLRQLTEAPGGRVARSHWVGYAHRLAHATIDLVGWTAVVHELADKGVVEVEDDGLWLRTPCACHQGAGMYDDDVDDMPPAGPSRLTDADLAEFFSILLRWSQVPSDRTGQTQLRQALGGCRLHPHLKAWALRDTAIAVAAKRHPYRQAVRSIESWGSVYGDQPSTVFRGADGELYEPACWGAARDAHEALRLDALRRRLDRAIFNHRYAHGLIEPDAGQTSPFRPESARESLTAPTAHELNRQVGIGPPSLSVARGATPCKSCHLPGETETTVARSNYEDFDGPVLGADPDQPLLSTRPRKGDGVGSLVSYFVHALKRVNAVRPQKWGVATNNAALGSHIKKALAAGSTADEIRLMIDLFMTDLEGGRVKSAQPAWKVFLSMASSYQAKAEHQSATPTSRPGELHLPLHLQKGKAYR